MKVDSRILHPEAHAFCPVCGKPFTETERVVADHTNNFQCHHCWNPVRKIESRKDSHFHAARMQGRVVPTAGKHRR